MCVRVIDMFVCIYMYMYKEGERDVYIYKEGERDMYIYIYIYIYTYVCRRTCMIERGGGVHAHTCMHRKNTCDALFRISGVRSRIHYLRNFVKREWKKDT